MHVVVCGAGYAGIILTRLLEEDLPVDVDLTLINDQPDHLVQHELHRVIRRPALADGITIPLEEVTDRATVRVARIDRIDRENRRIHLADVGDSDAGDRRSAEAETDNSDDGDGPTSDTLEYDFAAICLGAETATYGIEGVDEHALPLKRLAHANAIRERMLEAFEAFARGETAHLVVGGAGLSGVQVAGELAACCRESNIDLSSDRASVTLLEQTDSVAPLFDTQFQAALHDALEASGVTVRTGSAVIGADDGSVTVEGTDEPRNTEELPSDLFVWTGGIAGSSALDGDRPVVRRDLRLDNATFALGDAARVIDADGEAVPASAQAAIREARTAAENISRLVAYEREGGIFEPRLEGYSFDSAGWLVTVGDDAVAQVGPSVVTGGAALALKTSVGAGYLSAVGAVREAVDLVRSELGSAAGTPSRCGDHDSGAEMGEE